MTANTYNIGQMAMAKRVDIIKQFGKRVRDLRQAQKLSQEDLAERADLHYTYIGGVERGERNLSLKSIEKIASALGIDIRELFLPQMAKKADIESNKIISDINSILLSADVNTLRLIWSLAKDIDLWMKGNRRK